MDIKSLLSWKLRMFSSFQYNRKIELNLVWTYILGHLVVGVVALMYEQIFVHLVFLFFMITAPTNYQFVNESKIDTLLTFPFLNSKTHNLKLHIVTEILISHIVCLPLLIIVLFQYEFSVSFISIVLLFITVCSVINFYFSELAYRISLYRKLYKVSTFTVYILVFSLSTSLSKYFEYNFEAYSVHQNIQVVATTILILIPLIGIFAWVYNRIYYARAV